MRTNKDKYQSLNKDENEGMIELQELVGGKSISSNKNQRFYKNLLAEHSGKESEKPEVKRLSSNISPQQSFRASQVENPRPRQETVIPNMHVKCDYCTLDQNVAANTQVFVCQCCDNMNECYPLYGLFICGNCRCNVCYPYGTSQFIKCTRCKIVNRVRTEPEKDYISMPRPSVAFNSNQGPMTGSVQTSEPNKLIIHEEKESESNWEQKDQQEEPHRPNSPHKEGDSWLDEFISITGQSVKDEGQESQKTQRVLETANKQERQEQFSDKQENMIDTPHKQQNEPVQIAYEQDTYEQENREEHFIKPTQND